MPAVHDLRPAGQCCCPVCRFDDLRVETRAVAKLEGSNLVLLEGQDDLGVTAESPAVCSVCDWSGKLGECTTQFGEPSWTAILLYPDYSTGDFGADIYTGTETGVDPRKATKQIARRASEDNDGNIPPEDFRPIAVIAGDHMLELSAIDF